MQPQFILTDFPIRCNLSLFFSIFLPFIAVVCIISMKLLDKGTGKIMKSKQLTHSFLLLLTALIWGIAFVAQSTGGDVLGPYAFNSIRSIIGGIVLIPVIKILDALGFNHRKPTTKEDKKKPPDWRNPLWYCFGSCKHSTATGALLRSFCR